MKLLLFSGTHPRHIYVNREVIKHCDELMVIVMEREELIPTPPNNINEKDKLLFVKHFENRNIVERRVYGDLDYKSVFKGINTVFVHPNELNTMKIAKTVESFNADMAFIFGVNLILSPVIENLPKDKINLHLGLSPWYKGGATLYWPFYFLQPQFAGVTFHQITKKPDAGEIIHQSVPELTFGDKIHDVGTKCVDKAVEGLDLLFDHWKCNKRFDGQLQKTTGRVWRGVDFHPSQLRVIYDLFDDKIVDEYLSGNLEQSQPKLFSCLDQQVLKQQINAKGKSI
jgi:hypothetical protein